MPTPDQPNAISIGRSFARMSTSPTTTVIKDSPGLLHRVVMNRALALGTLTIYNNTAASGDVFAIITLPAALAQDCYTIEYGVWMDVGITAVLTLANLDVTFIYS